MDTDARRQRQLGAIDAIGALTEPESHTAPPRRDKQYLIAHAYCAAVVDEMRVDPERVRAIGRGQIPGIRKNVRGQALGWMDEWEVLLEGPLDELVEALTAHTEHAADLRGVAPFAGVLSEAERRDILLDVASRRHGSVGPDDVTSREVIG
jgi:hypothetical protein